MMATTRLYSLSRTSGIGRRSLPNACTYQHFCLQRARGSCRPFSSSSHRLEQQQQHRKESFSSRLRAALGKTKIQWYPIPVGLGVGFLGFLQFTKIQRRERERIEAEREEEYETPSGRPKKRPRTRPSGPWYAVAMWTFREDC